MPEIAIIGGTGVYDPGLLDNPRQNLSHNEYGDVAVTIGCYQGTEIAFIPRHGAGHSVPPHLINYQANIKALYDLGVKTIIATAAVGSLCQDYIPGDFVLADQFLDYTKNRKNTFYEGGSKGVVHCDMTVPYCPAVRQALYQTGQVKGIRIHNGGVYVCTEGPRFETAAEIQMFRILGGSIIGMTSVPEVCLARELGICYANLSIVTNFAAGISPGILTHAEVVAMMNESLDHIRGLMLDSIKYLSAERSCDCRKIVNEVKVNCQ
ncbi:MAG TPA: S-methyl-5'-thioadenosine phosphorylase [Syntrophomonadaceae bacterium]|nr:S-methyl-5'-thioadenosine phosphorylase [Syntrophomonadaceae bacterium]